MKQKHVFLIILSFSIGLAGCSDTKGYYMDNKQKEISTFTEEKDWKSFEIAECCREIYERAEKQDSLNDLNIKKQIIEYLGIKGYVAVDDKNQINMVNPDKVLEFIGKVDSKQKGSLTIVCVSECGAFTKYDLLTSDGMVEVNQIYLAWDGNSPEIRSETEYEAYTWKYTEEGYLFFEKYNMPGYDGPSGHTAIRVQPLDEKCRELNKEYILPISYERNNMFIIDWSENDYGELNFYDVFDSFYSDVYDQQFPYLYDENLGIGKIYHISKNEFENVIIPYFKIDSDILKSKTKFFEEEQNYEYRPRGLFDCESPSIPYPEVVDHKDNEDGTMTLTVNAVFPDKNVSKAFTHEVVIRPLSGMGFQYVSNHVIPSEDNLEITWHVHRLTDEEWKKYYGDGE